MRPSFNKFMLAMAFASSEAPSVLDDTFVHNYRIGGCVKWLTNRDGSGYWGWLSLTLNKYKANSVLDTAESSGVPYGLPYSAIQYGPAGQFYDAPFVTT